jgi:GH18 family chitinase
VVMAHIWVDYVEANSLGGVMFWELSSDTEDNEKTTSW